MTTTKTTCARPGCGGTTEGGCCDTCGPAPVPSQARLAADQRRRRELVDEANHVRPGTWS